MSYHLKNWAFARDMFCSDPALMREVLRNILKRDMNFSDITTEYIEDVVIRVGCTMTQDGFEASMAIWCSKLSRRLVGKSFEEFLSKLDETLDILIERWGREHDVSEMQKYA